MVDEVKKADKPTAQVYRFANMSRSAQIEKDLGPNGGPNPNGAVQPNAFESEDEYQQLYVGATRDQGIIQPPFALRSLDRLCQENNTLAPCIEVMVTNCERTGYSFEAIEEEEEDDEEDDTKIDELTEFFSEPWPGMSFMAIRELVRRDLERTGNGYFEVLRNAQDEIVLFRRVDSKMMRMLRLDDAVPIDQTVMRKGKEVKLAVMTRERRFCQLVNGVSLMYFKEFGSKRDLHKKTAVWAPQGQRLPANMRATEIMHFTVILDAHTPYGIPRWINQMPSVLGSRKAEEFNLQFFDNGGVPPVMIVIQGGTLGAETRRAVEQMNSGAAAKNNRIQVLEMEPTAGTTDQVPKATITVERFGGDRTKDSMFELYDKNCEVRVRRSFRLPQILLGDSASYNFATAFAAYVLAEAQVFKPERDAFDEIITMRLLKAMGYNDYCLTSKPLVLDDATLKLQGVEIVATMQQVEPADVVKAINDITGTRMKVSNDAQTLKEQLEPPPQPVTGLNPGTTHTIDPATGKVQLIPGANKALAPAAGAAGAPGAVPGKSPIKPINPQPTSPAVGTARLPGAPGVGGKSPGPIPIPKVKTPAGNNASAAPAKKGDDDYFPETGLEIAHMLLTSLRKRDFPALAKGLTYFERMDVDSQALIQSYTTDLMFVDPSLDPEGLSELSAATMRVMGCGHIH